MPRGYPDYFGQSIFPKYGGFKTYQHSELNLSSVNYTTIVNVTAKGKIYDGYLCFVGTAMDVFAKLKVTIDGAVTQETTLDFLLNRFWSFSNRGILNIIAWNDEDEYYYVQVGKDITFEQSYKIEAKGTNDNSLNCTSVIYYAQVV